MIRIEGLDTKLHGEKLTNYLSKRGINYAVVNSLDDCFDIAINNTCTEKVKFSYEYEMISIFVMSMPADGYDIMRDEYNIAEVF